jgi:hypothetical protein
MQARGSPGKGGHTWMRKAKALVDEIECVAAPTMLPCRV